MKQRFALVAAIAAITACSETPTETATPLSIAPTKKAVTTVFTSDASVTAWDPIYMNMGSNWPTTACTAAPAVSLNDSRWANPHAASDFGTGAHPWQPGATASGFSADWINAWGNINSGGGPGYDAASNPSAHNWTKYERQVTGNGSFQLQLLADNCSWIYLDGVLAGVQGDSWNYNSLKYGVTLNGTHTLTFIIFDGGGAAGGMFRLETTTNPPPPLNNDLDGDGHPNAVDAFPLDPLRWDASNLIANGSFERPIIGAVWSPNANKAPWLTIDSDNQGLPSWNVDAGDVDVQSGEGGGQFTGVPEGVQVLDMNGATISQGVVTKANYKYRVSFSMSQNYFCMAGGTASLRVSMGGTSKVFSFAPGAGESWQNMRWDALSFEAVTSSFMSTLQFVSTQYGTCGGAMIDNVSVQEIGPADTTPPVITPTVVGTLGTNGWYTSNVSVTWSVVDGESAITSSTGCAAASVTADASGQTFTCAATSGGGSASQSVTIKRDATKPVIAFAGNAGTYTVDQTVAITCSATDAMSGIASSICPAVNANAYTLAIGNTTVNASAADKAGNASTASATFSVSVTSASLCTLVKRWVTGAGLQNSFCQQLKNGEDTNDFREHMKAQRGKSITAANADILIALSRLLPTKKDDDSSEKDKSSGKDGDL